MKAFYLFLKEFKFGALPIRVITRKKIYDLSIEQGKNLITEHLLFLSCE